MYFIKDNKNCNSYSVRILLNVDNDYLIRRIVSGEWKEDNFKYKNSTDENNIMRKPLIIKGLNDKVISSEPYKPSISSPISYFYEKYNKKAKQQRKLRKIKDYRLKQMNDTLKVRK